MNVPGFDVSGGRPLDTPYGPAVFVPLAWLAPGQLALVCAERCLKRLGADARPNHVMQEAYRLMGHQRGFSLSAAKRALKEVANIRKAHGV